MIDLNELKKKVYEYAKKRAENGGTKPLNTFNLHTVRRKLSNQLMRIRNVVLRKMQSFLKPSLPTSSVAF